MTKTNSIGVEPVYLGDGVYASFDGYQIWLATNKPKNDVIAIEPGVFNSLCDFVEIIKAKYNEAREIAAEAVKSGEGE